MYKGGKGMKNTKMPYAKRNSIGEEPLIACDALEKEEYDRKYKGILTCYKGCRAKIKFTQRKNGYKFFSTWNKEGHLHSLNCPYHVNYKGKIGRMKLEAYYKSIEPTDEVILNRLKDKMNRLMQHIDIEHFVEPENGTMEVENEGERIVPIYESEENGEKTERLPNLKYEDAEFITVDDVKCIKSVIGLIDNVQLEEDKYGKKYAYINLVTSHSNVSFAIPEAFYEHELVNGEHDFCVFIEKVAAMVQDKPKEIRVIGYGSIIKKKRNKNGVNILIISPYRLLVDNKNFWEILRE